MFVFCPCRSCRSSAEAQALQARWYSSAGAITCSSSTSVVAISSSCSTSSTSIAAPASMSSSADSSCSTGNSGVLGPAAINNSSAAMAAFTGMRAKGRETTAGTCPAQSPPCPALSCLLPALTVAGHCWPSTFWPAASAAVTVPAALLSRKGSAAAQGADSTDAPEGIAASAGTAAASRPIFALSPRLSIELDVTHRLGSSGSIGSLAAQCAAADAAADAVATSYRTLDQLPSPTAAEDQAVILHKVRLSGPNELESLLFGSATTSHPDTTVARIMKPQQSSSSSHAGLGSMNTLAHAYSWAAPGGFNTSGFGCYSTSTNTSVRQQQCVNGWTTGGWAVAGTPHHAPRRSASVNIALLSRHLHGSGSCSSSAASSQQSYGSLKVAAGSSGSHLGRDSLAGASKSQRSSLEGMPPVSNRPVPAAAGSSGQWQQLGRVPESSSTQPALFSQAASLPAGIPTAGRVSKARSYMALSALQAAGSSELADALAAAAQSTAAAASRSPPGGGVMAAASADAAGLLSSRSSGGGGRLYPQVQQQLHFRPAFRSALHTTNAGAPAALQNRFRDSPVLASGQLPRQQPLPRLSADVASLQRTPSIHAQASLADSLASCDASSDQDCTKEGKVHGGLSRSNSSILLALAAEPAPTGSACDSALQQALHAGTSASSPKAAQQLAARSSSSGGMPAARLVTFAPSDNASDKEQQGSASALAPVQPAAAAAGGNVLPAHEVSGDAPSEKCVRGGHSKLARLEHSRSSPELKSLAMPGTQTRARRSSVVLPPYSSSNKHQPQQLGGLAHTGGTLPASWQDSSAMGADAASSLSISPFAAGSMTESEPSFSGLLPRVPQQQRPVTFASAFAQASACSLSPAGSRELVEGSFCADGAVHGGELGEQALEGQMHGGRRSKSMVSVHDPVDCVVENIAGLIWDFV